MATAIAELPHLAADLKALYLSTVASQWRPPAEQARSLAEELRATGRAVALMVPVRRRRAPARSPGLELDAEPELVLEPDRATSGVRLRRVGLLGRGLS